MFTGLVETVGRVRAIRPDPSADGVTRIAIEAPKIADGIPFGASVCVSGACLTAISSSGGAFEAQVMAETLRVTKLGSLKAGARVNLERAMQAGGRLDGHIVQGHVDAVGRVLSIEGQGGASATKKLFISAAEEISFGIAQKGSICIDGVSLTVIDSFDDRFSVGLIPTTMAETTIGDLRPGDEVNIEIDVIARYVARMLGRGSSAPSGGMTWEKLARYGWI